MEPHEGRQERSTTPSGTPLAKRRHAMRLLRDENNELVLAYELTGERDTDPRTLVLESSDGRAVQRLSRYPANWRTVNDAELLALRPDSEVKRPSD